MCSKCPWYVNISEVDLQYFCKVRIYCCFHFTRWELRHKDSEWIAQGYIGNLRYNRLGPSQPLNYMQVKLNCKREVHKIYQPYKRQECQEKFKGCYLHKIWWYLYSQCSNFFTTGSPCWFLKELKNIGSVLWFRQLFFFLMYWKHHNLLRIWTSKKRQKRQAEADQCLLFIVMCLGIVWFKKFTGV